MSELEAAIHHLADQLVAKCRAKGLRLATAESCTGGLIAAAITEIPGSSDVLDCGFVTYSNTAKTALLAVPESTLARHGAVSEAAARAMAEGALQRSSADITLSVTGIAGPGGGSAAKPVGTVHLSLASRQGLRLHELQNYGDIGRASVRHKTVIRGLEMLLEASSS